MFSYVIMVCTKSSSWIYSTIPVISFGKMIFFIVRTSFKSACFSNFLNDDSILACLALSGRILLVIQNDDATKLHVFDTIGNLENSKQIGTGGKSVELGLCENNLRIYMVILISFDRPPGWRSCNSYWWEDWKNKCLIIHPSSCDSYQ